MPPCDFWHGDMRELDAYRIAYTRDVSYNNWVNGQYVKLAFEIAYSNCWAKNVGDRRNYINWEDPIKPDEKQSVVTKDNLEEEYRKRLSNTNEWLNAIIMGV